MPKPVRWRAYDPDGNPHEFIRKPENVCEEVAWELEDGTVVTTKPKGVRDDPGNTANGSGDEGVEVQP